MSKVRRRKPTEPPHKNTLKEAESLKSRIKELERSAAELENKAIEGLAMKIKQLERTLVKEIRKAARQFTKDLRDIL